MHRARGFLSLDLMLMLAAGAAIVGVAAWLHHAGVASERAKWEAANSEAREQRKATISGLALDLANVRGELAAARVHHETELRDLRDNFKGNLNAYVPKTADSATCLRAGFVRFIDAAAAGMPLASRPEPGTADAPAGLETTEAAAVIADNFVTCHAYQQRAADILTEFDALRSRHNAAVATINQSVKESP